MEFDKKDNIEKIGKIIGFVTMYVVFTVILYFILRLFDKIPNNWNFFYLGNLTLFIVLIGTLIKIFLSQ